MAALIGPIKANFSWEIALIAFAVMMALALLFVQFLNIDKQVECVTTLENKDVEDEVMMVMLAEI